VAYQKLNGLVKTIKELQQYNTDSVIGITGSEGTGKSTLTLQFLRRLLYDYRADSDMRFNLERNVAYTANEVDKKLRAAPDGTGLNIDEAGRLFYMRDAMTRLTREGIKLFQQIRFRRLAIFLNIPPFFSLDKEIRNKRIWLWIHVVEKGHALYFLRDENVFAPDPWHAKKNMDLIERYYKGPKSGLDALINGYKNTVNFIDEFEFPRLPSDIEERYSAISHERKLAPDEPVSITNREKLWRDRARKAGWLLQAAGYERKDLQDFWGVSATVLSDMMVRTPEFPRVACWPGKPEIADVIVPWRKDEEIKSDV